MNTPRPIPVRPVVPVTPAQSVERAAYAAFAAASGRLGVQRAHEAVQKLYPDDRSTLEVITRAAAPLGTMGGWGADLVQNPVAAFFGSLGPESAMASIIGRGLSLPLNPSQTESIPVRPGGPVSVPWVAEGDPITVREGVFDAVTLGPARKLATMTTMSSEVASRGSAEAVFRRTLREDAGLALDTVYFSSDAASSAGVAGLLNGVTATATGGPPENLVYLASEVAEGGSGQIVFITTPALAVRVPFISPNLQITILPSRAVPSGRVIALDPLAIAHGFDGLPDISASKEAVVHMSDDPDPIVDGDTADPVRSLFQTDAIALRMIVDLAFAKLRDNAVAYSDGVVW